MKKAAQKPETNSASRSMPKSLSWVVERDALRKCADRKSRAILAIFHARRCAKTVEFFVPPQIAKLNGLTPGDLNWALDRLEGLLVKALGKKKGEWRIIQLLPEFEAAAVDSSSRGRKNGSGSQFSSDEEKVTLDEEGAFRCAISAGEAMDSEVAKVLSEIASHRRPC